MCIQSNLKVSTQCARVVKSANSIVGLIKRCFSSRDKEVLIPLYRSLVRPHLEYCVQIWSPHLVKDVELLEGVQRRFTKLIDGMHGLTYEQRLLELDMTSLQVRRMRGDLIQVFKMIKGIDNVCLNDFLLCAIITCEDMVLSFISNGFCLILVNFGSQIECWTLGMGYLMMLYNVIL